MGPFEIGGYDAGRFMRVAEPQRLPVAPFGSQGSRSRREYHNRFREAPKREGLSLELALRPGPMPRRMPSGGNGDRVGMNSSRAAIGATAGERSHWSADGSARPASGK